MAGVLAQLLIPVAQALGEGSWQRVKACRAPNCHWAFYDRSRNHSGVWCEMAVCGNRTKVRTYPRAGPARAGAEDLGAAPSDAERRELACVKSCSRRRTCGGAALLARARNRPASRGSRRGGP